MKRFLNYKNFNILNVYNLKRIKSFSLLASSHDFKKFTYVNNGKMNIDCEEIDLEFTINVDNIFRDELIISNCLLILEFKNFLFYSNREIPPIKINENRDIQINWKINYFTIEESFYTELMRKKRVNIFSNTYGEPAHEFTIQMKNNYRKLI